jgi:uncharacterized protein (TIGR00297 family)
MNYAQTLTVGLALASAIALAGWRARALSASGAVASVIVGTVAVAAGWSWAVVVIVYFLAGSLLSRFRASEKAARTDGRLEKGHARDAVQVMANGAVFTLAAVGHRLAPDPVWQSIAAGGLAASAADTWATEIGTLARGRPRSIIDGRPVEVGESGGVTLQGFGAGFLGALLIALVALAVGWSTASAVAALVGGMVGCVLDSLRGATVQSRRWCASCGAATEQRIHRCGATTTFVGGLRWLDNDGVNALSTLGGALFGATSGRYF